MHFTNISEFTIEIIGYIAMFLVGISFLMKNVRTLRFINLIGCLIFIFWGILINKPPVYILNSFIVLVNFYYLFLRKKK